MVVNVSGLQFWSRHKIHFWSNFVLYVNGMYYGEHFPNTLLIFDIVSVFS